MNEWIDREIDAVIEVNCDESTMEFRPVIVIGDKKLSWDEFGDEVTSFEGWSLKFKFYSTYMPPEKDSD